jgi:hypothetical protein
MAAVKVKFKLAQIFAAGQAWQELAKVPKPAVVSYHCGAFYGNHYLPVLAKIEEERNRLIKQFGTEEKDTVSGEVINYKIAENTPAMKQFMVQFSELCEQEEELPLVGCTFDQLMQAMALAKDDKGKPIMLPDYVLMQVEKFFPTTGADAKKLEAGS